MTKSDLILDVAAKAGLSKHKAGLAVEALLESIIIGLAKTERVELRGFGTFKVKHRAARTGRDPRSGEPVAIPAKKVVLFRPGRELKLE